MLKMHYITLNDYCSCNTTIVEPGGTTDQIMIHELSSEMQNTNSFDENTTNEGKLCMHVSIARLRLHDICV